MDIIAANAQTTKRTVYAHFESKEKLFLAVGELVRETLNGKLGHPSDYANDAVQALALFSVRFPEILLEERAVRMCRLSIAEAERFAEGSMSFYEAIFGTAQQRAALFVAERFPIDGNAAWHLAEEILTHALRLSLIGTLFGMARHTTRADGMHDDTAAVVDFVSRSIAYATSHGAS